MTHLMFSQNPPHALSKPTSCSLVTLLLTVSYSLNPPPNGEWPHLLPQLKYEFFREKITSAVSGNQRPSFKINLSDSQTLPLRREILNSFLSYFSGVGGHYIRRIRWFKIYGAFFHQVAERFLFHRLLIIMAEADAS